MEFLRLFVSRRNVAAMDCLAMWKLNNIAARAMIWCVVFATPLQAFPATTRSCIGGEGCCQQGHNSKGCDCCGAVKAAIDNAEHGGRQLSTGGPCRCTGASVCCCVKGSCCRAKAASCCRGARATKSCCSLRGGCCDGTGCQCGPNCQCGCGGRPAEPTAPPVENCAAVQKVIGDSLPVVSAAVHCQTPTARRSLDLSKFTADTRTALDQCASLCRFTL